MATSTISFIPSPATLGHRHIPKFSLSSISHLSSRRAPPSKLNFKLVSSPLTAVASTLRATSSSATGSLNEATGASSSGLVGQNDLLIVGPGVLGRLVARQWREEHPECQVYGQTVTTDHHDELTQMGITPTLKGMKLAQQFPYVIFCAPPSRSPDYTGDVSFPGSKANPVPHDLDSTYTRAGRKRNTRMEMPLSSIKPSLISQFLREAALSWTGEGSFVFTSSSALYDRADNGYCDEDTPVVPMGKSPRTDVLLKAENVVLGCGGCVLRLAGLYISFESSPWLWISVNRGAHMYWLKQTASELRPDHMINQIHYEDAASLAVAILKKNLHGQVFLGCDNNPLSRLEIMDLVNKSGKFSGKFEGFTGATGPLGKRLDNSRTCEEIGWEPKYPSFAQFLEEL
ncbi:hypothetical protein Cgig2_023782 [Carnegiea gigantea]|uniref:NAD(P)-binding Rossmann-fold superfamily protein n=1 Tax=Carnegiea gigantea TaxID=171969 RepID=A0A9Q1JRD1_9CARY|nr:hypothetical protein Cgig2_023782 [Carnegiea gigantea]